MQYRLPSNLPAEIDELERLIGAFKDGRLSGDDLKSRRVPFGVYEQRTKGTYMVRVRCAAGAITPVQLRKAAHLAARYATGRLHVTTRQELQVHDVRLDDVPTIIRELATVGLSSRGGGGNTVRNVTASWDSGVAVGEVFDVAPAAVELTSRLIERGDSWLLPRKFKIAFSNSGQDNALASMNDVGFIARIRDGKRGYKVYVAGGMGRMPQAAQLLHDFVPEQDVFEIAEAVKRLFSKRGNRRNRHSARLRFLWNALGRERFVEAYLAEREALRVEGPAPFQVEPSPKVEAPLGGEGDAPRDPAYTLWKKRFVREQAQKGLYSVRVPLPLGDIQSSDAARLADLLEPLGPETLRFTIDQNLALRNIPAALLGKVRDLSAPFSPASSKAPLVGNAVACAGASTCQLGICLSRGALGAALDALDAAGLELDALDDFRLHVSGCSNSCGQHGIAHLGFFGRSSRKGERSYPAYNVVAGAVIDAESGSTLARPVDEVAAKHVPGLVVAFLARYTQRRTAYPDFTAFVDAEGESLIKAYCQAHREAPDFEADPAFYRDWGAAADFTLEGRGTGECAAGLFDLIDLDLARARTAREKAAAASGPGEKDAAIRSLVLHAAHALLITRGVESPEIEAAPELFIRNFVEAELASTRFVPLLKAAESGEPGIAARAGEAAEFLDAVTDLHASLDATLQFHVQAPAKAELKPDLVKDLRGVACPMNFVKTKMELSRLAKGQTLKVLLDDGEPSDNVPRSVAAEGHKVLEKTKLGGHWEVTVEKAG